MTEAHEYLEAQPVSLRRSVVVSDAAEWKRAHPEFQGSDRSAAALQFLETFRGERFTKPTGVLCAWCQKKGRLVCHCRWSHFGAKFYDPLVRN